MYVFVATVQLYNSRIMFAPKSNDSIDIGTMLLFSAALLISSVFVFNWIKNRKCKNLPPGPIGLPFFGYWPFLGKCPSKTLARLSEKYGDIFSLYLGRNCTIVFNDIEIMREALSNPAALNRPSEVFQHIPGGVGFSEFNGPEWEEQRRFSLQAMKNLGFGKGPWEDLIIEEVRSFMDYLIQLKSSPIDISQSLSESVSSSIASLLFGRRLDKDKERDKLKLLVEFADACFKSLSPSSPAILLPSLRKIFQYLGVASYVQADSVMSKMSAFVREEIFKHEALKEDQREREDFIHLYLERMNILQNSENGTKYYFTRKSLEGNLKALFLGSSDTIINSLLWMYRLMAFHTDIQSKIHAELDDVFGRDGEPKFENRHSVPYTFATLMEMERFASIVPLNSPRMAGEDFVVRGYTIPKGSTLLSNLWSMHYDPRYWDKPEEFRPERFLSPDGSKIINAGSYSPFSVGSRKCPGEAISWIEMFYYFVRVMQKFRVTGVENEDIDFETIDGLVTQMKNPQKLCFVERETNIT